MSSDLKYPVQPFVFEFAKEASKNLNFKDIYVKPSQNIDLSPVDQYLQANGSFLDEFTSSSEEQSQPSMSSIENCKVRPIFFEKDFDLRRSDIFKQVFPKDCLKKRLFHEELLLQLDAVQSLLFHSSDQHALEFFRSFSTIHDMNHELSVLLPQVKNMRSDLHDLNDMSKSSETIAKHRLQKERLNQLSEIVATMQRITHATPTAIALADRQEYDSAFQLVDELIGLLPSMLGIKALRSQLQKLKDTKELIARKAKSTFYQLFTNEAGTSTEIIDTLQKHNLIESAVVEAKQFIGEYAVESVKKILNDAAEQKEFKCSQLSVLSVHDFTEVLSAASPNIRSRILAKSTDAISKITKEFENRGIPTDGLVEVSQVLVDKVFREITTVVSSHPLNSASLNDFSSLMEAMISISRSFDKFDIDTTLISASIITLGRSFVESYHCEQMKRLTQALAQEKFTKTQPSSNHIDMLRRLTAADVNGLVIKNEHYGSTTSLLVLLEVTWSYWQAARRLPKTQDEITCKMCETIKLFNTQCHDLVLLGGTSQTVKMKKVTTKNLALSASGICFFINLIPFIKPRISAVGATNDVVNLQFNSVVKSLETHLNQIIEKIIDVMAKSITNRCNNASFAQQQTSQFILDIVQEVTTLNNVLNDCLPSEIITAIFRKVSEKISQEVSKIAAKAKRELVQRDLDFLNEKLKAFHCSVHIPGYTVSSDI
ncbi:hypothetical protein TRFO_19082 [Tritrichomonas foetus]|uniref:Vacuolar protein sorting-associated protein 54 C-terminal domain-containing protein n=1 Tax=Tritrichomonas foetus TaxID=1144522 RepID=A0A1J4KJD4_9EUKA|nr:hypothetical protein TRFO_19082 [Tritrichomonas foetus]|eukprot:OHT11449.1 hypothetical protein TRFO_19082 [Tritrichomonas foetus]